MENKKVAIIGTQGVPAQYGGFESLAENLIGPLSSDKIRYTVYCSSKAYSQKLYEYKNASLEYIPFDANGAQSIIYDIISLLKARRKSDVLLILGVSGCCFLPIFRVFAPNKKLVTNIDGLEHRREKWNKYAKMFLKYSEKMAVKYSDIIITDNKGIQDYVTEEYGKSSVMIAYGGDHAVQNSLSTEQQNGILQKYNLAPTNYSITVCRIEPENNCHIILDAFSQTDKNLVFIGNWNKSKYGQDLKEKYSQFKNIKILDPIYDLNILYALRSNAHSYIHGHSAGGTNPSLVEAMFFGIPIIAYDVVYNRETTHGKALYFNSVEKLREILTDSVTDLGIYGSAMKQLALENYTWQTIVKQYESLY